MADVTISINSGIITVDNKHVKVKVKSEKVTWKCHDGTFSIIFNTKGGVSLPPGSNPTTTNSGSVWKAEAGPFPTENVTYSYQIEAPGATTLDPEIEVIP